MPVVAESKNELKKAIKNKERKIIVRGKLAKKIMYLRHVPNKEIDSDMSETQLQSVLAGVMTPAVSITLILMLGVVAITAILRGYKINVKTRIGEVILEKR